MISDFGLAVWVLSLFLLAYVYAGFPVLLGLVSLILRKHHRSDRDHEPTVTLIISAYNEEAVIREKIDNSLAIDYPPEKLDILVVSDASDDRTDSLVLACGDPRVRLLRVEGRRGKTMGLNAALEQIRTELVLFSDANALYDSQAVSNMVRHFADPGVGYVVGHARYIDSSSTAAGESENLYWNFEIQLKQWESDVHSVVGGDGAIYMIRRSLYQPLEATDINDFVNPLQIVAAGFRGIFDPSAFCVEAPADDFEKEFGRKVRIVNRSFNGFLRVRQLLNPLRYGRFSWLLFSHKVLRWFSPFLLLAHFIATLLLPMDGLAGLIALGSLTFYTLIIVAATIGLLNEQHGGRVFSYAKFFYYFMLMNVASAFGVLSRLQGRRIVTWTTVRSGGGGLSMGARTVATVLACAGLLTVLRLVTLLPGADVFLRNAVFFLNFLIAYTLVGYPLVLMLLRRPLRKPHRIDESRMPTVTLLIPAYNEALVLADKLANTLELDYPRECLRILVISDGSTDGSNAIAQQFAGQGVELLALSPNRGKITALNRGMETVTSEIVVLSDANALYDPQAIRKLVRHFADPAVGGVSGKVSLINGKVSYATAEKKYYNIEHLIQQIEGETGSLIGSDGAMYALRRELYPFPPADTVLDDFVISMAIIRQGFRLLHEPEAVGHERNLAEIDQEFQRKVRIIAGGIQTLLRGQAFPPRGDLLNWFKLLSHKVLRWLLGPMAVLALLLSFFRLQMSPPLIWPMKAAIVMMAVFFFVGCSACLIPGLKRHSWIVLPHYLLVMLGASLAGCWRGLLGSQTVTWKQSQE